MLSFSVTKQTIKLLNRLNGMRELCIVSFVKDSVGKK